MKKARKLTALMLLAAFVFAFIVPVTAMAATDGSITLDNPKAGQTYTAYKIFDVTYTTDKSSYSYTIAGDSEWFDVVATKNDDGTVTSKVNGLTFTKAASGDVYVVTKADGFSAAAFADTLKANTTDKTGVDLEDATVDGKAVKQKTGLPLG